jgi:hypothetical protein
MNENFENRINTLELSKIAEIVNRAQLFGLTTEVVYTALKEMRLNPDKSSLLCLQIAAEDWDI